MLSNQNVIKLILVQRKGFQIYFVNVPEVFVFFRWELIISTTFLIISANVISNRCIFPNMEIEMEFQIEPGGIHCSHFINRDQIEVLFDILSYCLHKDWSFKFQACRNAQNTKLEHQNIVKRKMVKW